MSARSNRPTITGFSFGLLVSTLAAFVAFKWNVIGRYRLEDLFVGLGVETCVFGWLWWLSERAATFLPRRANLVRGVLFYPAFYFVAGLIFSYTIFFDSAVERRFSLLDVSGAGMVYFFTNVLPPHGYGVLLGILLSSHVGALLLRKTALQPSSKLSLALLSGLTVVATLGAHNAVRVATPLYDIAYDVAELGFTPRVEIRANTAAFAPITELDKSKKPLAITDTPFKKVLLFVMETTTSKMFDEELLALPKDNFFTREKAHLRNFSRYFPINQDSRTGLLALMGSRLIPCEAYTDACVEKYQYVKGEKSLIEDFAALGYRSAFAVSQTDLEPVITEMRWHQILRLSEADIEAAKKSKLCFTPYEFEHSCEDLVLMPKVVDFFEKNERAFVLQEMIWGHASEYNEASGLSTTDYYARYLDALTKELEKRGLLDETLIAITSDHGFRSKGLQGQIDAYRMPMMFYAKRFTAQDDARLFSHLDFRDLLFDALAPGSAQLDRNEFVLIQGPTGTQMIAALTAEQDFMLVKTRSSARLLLKHENLASNPPSPARKADGAEQLVKLFDDYRSAFEARGRRLAKR